MKFSLKLLSSLVLILILSEVLIRGIELTKPSVERYEKEVLNEFWFKAQGEMLNPKRVYFFQIPYITFENNNIHDVKRIKKVFEQTLGPVGTTVITSNNLSDSPEKFRYTLNSLGFRGPLRDINKKRGSFRILALGTYQTWGLGVNDEETYPALLEKEFANQDPAINVEVWNAGRMSSKAITGLAHLIHNGLRIKPDLVILDYGFADSLKINRDPRILPGAVEIKLRRLSKYFYIIRRFNELIYSKPKIEDPLDEFRSVMSEMISILKLKGINVLIMEQQFFLTPLTKPWFKEAEEQGLPILKIDEAFKESPPSADEWDRTEWIKDVPKELRGEISLLTSAPYKTNPFHLNAKGNAVIAKALRSMISKKKLLRAP